MANVKENAVRKLPLIIKRKDLVCDNYELVWRRNKPKSLYKEDIIYKASADDFLKGKYPNLVLINKLNVEKNDNHTIARYSSSNSSTVELTSDAITRLIGQKNYNTLLAALCSVISQDLRIQGILSLLLPDIKECTIKTEPIYQANSNLAPSKPKLVDADTQTDQSSMNLLIKEKQRSKRLKRQQVRSYIIKKDDVKKVRKLKKVIINPIVLPKNVKTQYDGSHKNPCDNYKNNLERPSELPDIKQFVDEDSNISTGSIGQFSIASHDIPDSVITNYSSLVRTIINKHTGTSTTLKLFDGSELTVRAKFEDQFHYVTEDVLSQLHPNDQQRLKWHQVQVDFAYSLQRDQDNNLLLHNAVLNNDVDLLRRQCIMLKKRGEIVDILGAGNLTALQMAIFQDSPQCTATLLKYGADPLITDDEGRTALHLAAEVDSKHLEEVIAYCKYNARKVLRDNDEFWKPEMETKPDDELANYLVHRICTLCDSQGYTPLMLACKLGRADSVGLLIKASPNTINMKMPNCGNTALYLAVGSACLDAASRGNKSKVSDCFKKTVELLVVNGADPSIDNSSGSNVNVLLTECSISELSMLIANKLTSVNFFNGSEVTNFGSYILLKDSKGKVGITEMNSPKNYIPQKVSDVVMKKIKEENDIDDTGVVQNEQTDKPIILENIAILPTLVPVKKSNKVIYKPVATGKKTVGMSPEIIILHKNETKTVVQKTQVDKNKPKYVKILPKTSQPDFQISPTVKITATKRLSGGKAGPSSNKKQKNK